MATQGPDFTVDDFLNSFGKVVRPSGARPLVVHDADLQELSGQISNPSRLRIAGTLPTTTFELFRQIIPPSGSSDMQRHYHETVHFVIGGDGHSDIEDVHGSGNGETVTWTTGSFIYTPPWAWHRHFNDSTTESVEFLTIENSRLLGLFGLVRRQSAGMVDIEQAQAQFKEDR